MGRICYGMPPGPLALAWLHVKSHCLPGAAPKGDVGQPGLRRSLSDPGMKIPAEPSSPSPRRCQRKSSSMSQEGTKQTLSPLGQYLSLFSLYRNRPRQEIKQSFESLQRNFLEGPGGLCSKESCYDNSYRPWGSCHSTCSAEHLVTLQWPRDGREDQRLALQPQEARGCLPSCGHRAGTSPHTLLCVSKCKRPLCTCPETHPL